MERRPNEVSAKGYYYNLDISPHVWLSPCGDSFHLPSAKKLEMIEKRVPVALRRLEKLLDAHNLRGVLPPDLVRMLQRYIIQAVYEELVRR